MVSCYNSEEIQKQVARKFLITAFFTSNIEGICKYVNIKDDAEVMEGVSKMCGLGDTIYERGIEQGIEQGGMKMLVSLVKDGLLTLSDACQKANMSEPEFIQLMEHEEKDNQIPLL